ncbi:hypothetical protein TeGR_g10182 [Tetraparma gracilis]|uniref:ubiquitinyl hydrolase 1 n=1 Tax=Tetraparma gracilis TaxID=2962635 RepID=A0ABQ6MAI2_9STRA|nr:hypothetical protein TeGR_g10182 [Tetraparma gracilis]
MHDIELVVVKKMPFPLTNREFLNRYLSFKELSGDLVLVFEALPDGTKVDYGANLKVVRAKSTGTFRFKPLNDDSQCEVTLVHHGHAGGFVPERVMVAKIPQALSAVSNMREHFQRDDAIDDAKRSELAEIINTSKQPYLPNEDKFIDEVSAKFASMGDAAFEKLDSPDHFVHMFSAFKEGSSTTIGRATTIVDATIAEVAAWELAKMSRGNLKGHVEFGGLDRDLLKINDHQSIYHVVYDLSIPKFLPRQWVGRVFWKWAADKKELTVVGDSVEHDEFPERKEYLRASSTGVLKYKEEAEVGGCPQTKVTWIQQLDLGGAIPKWVQNRQGVGNLMYLSTMRKRFDKSPAIDTASNLRLVTMIQNHDEPYTEIEEEILRVGVSHFSTFDSQKGKELKMASTLTQAKIAFEKGDGHAWGWAKTTVKASPEHVLAHVLDYYRRSKDTSKEVERSMKVVNDHNRELYQRYMKSRLARVTAIQVFHLGLRGLAEWDEKDGEAVGEVLVTKTDAEKHHGKGETTVEARLRELMEKQKGLKELGEKWGWFEVLLTKIVENKLRPGGDSKAKLCNMSEKEANVIGGALASSIAANLSAPAAVDEWILRYPAMEELEREYVWFRPMMDTIAQRLLESVSWGLKLRLYAGAGLSTLDLITDLYMIYTYATTDKPGTALSLGIMVGLCLLFQLLVVWTQARKGPTLVMLKEMLIVLSGMKPGWDAVNVANGAERSSYALVDPSTELVYTRCIEMCFESVPGSVLTTYATLHELAASNILSKRAVGSIVVSALTTGFSAATISFDFDVSPEKRRDEPDFYGYIPDAASSRTLIFGCMIMNSALLLLVRSVSMALLAMVGGRWVLVYLVSDMGMYFVYKILSYVPSGGKVYELDGLKPGPVVLGDVPGGDNSGKGWMRVARERIQDRIERYAQTEIKFNLMAVVEDKRVKIQKVMELDPGDVSLVEALEREEAKRAGWETENARRQHNSIPFVIELVRQLAEKGKLRDVMKKGEEKVKAKKEAGGGGAAGGGKRA